MAPIPSKVPVAVQSRERQVSLRTQSRVECAAMLSSPSHDSGTMAAERPRYNNVHTSY